MTKGAEVTKDFFAAPQLQPEDLRAIAERGIRAIINNRPDGEEVMQPSSDVVATAAREAGLEYRHIPVVAGKLSDQNLMDFELALTDLPGPVLGFCKSGTRAATLWALSEAVRRSPAEILERTAKAGYDLKGLRPRLNERWLAGGHRLGPDGRRGIPGYDVVIVGGGAAGIAVAASLLRQRADTSIAIVEPGEVHHYQAGFTLVGGGVFDHAKTSRPEKSCIPEGAHWVHAAAAAFEPDENHLVLEDGERVAYRTLVVCPGIKLDWERVEGLTETLGANRVCSNYMPGLPPYTWQTIQEIEGGEALFTQPPMPIKCAGAPQKIMYLASDYWRRRGTLGDTHVQFNASGGVIFGVEAFQAPLMKYVERYGIDLAFMSTLKAIDGAARKAWFDVMTEDGTTQTVEKTFDMIHVAPPQTTPDFVRTSPLADEDGWIDVDSETLRHKRYENIFGLGDACSAPSAKTAAAVRKQAPVVVRNVAAMLDGRPDEVLYDGYGSCPLVVARGKTIMAEFGYGGKLMPTFPLDPTVPRWSMWLVKTRLLPYLYWDVLFKGREWLARPKRKRSSAPRTAPTPVCDFQEPETRHRAHA